MTQVTNNKRIAKNTLLLYFRMIFMMGVSLYTSRVVLAALGVEDFGIYTVVSGVITLLGFLNGAMATATQRYITFELGSGDRKKLEEVFCTSVSIHWLIAFTILLLGETVGLWFFYEKMVIPQSRVDSAFWVYQFSIVSTMVMMVSVPYNAVIIAHERMSAFAYISILEVSLKLIAVYALYLTKTDKLIFYSAMICVIQVVVRLVYGRYCSRHFEEVKCEYTVNMELFRKMLGFASWNLWGNLAGVLSTQGVNLLLNMFFGPVVNAARGVAIQLQGAVQQFSMNFQTAINPQITKTYAQHDFIAMHKLIIRSSRFSFFLLYVLSLPIFLLTSSLLDFWLEEVPPYTDTFLRISLLIVLVDSMTNPMMVAAAATGNVKRYQSIVGGVILLITPLAYIVLKLGMGPVSVFIVHGCIAVVAFFIRLIIIQRMIYLKTKIYLLELGKSIWGILIFSLPPSLIAYGLFDSTSFIGFVLIACISVLSTVIAIFCVGLDNNERMFIVQKVKELKKYIS